MKMRPSHRAETDQIADVLEAMGKAVKASESEPMAAGWYSTPTGPVYVLGCTEPKPKGWVFVRSEWKPFPASTPHPDGWSNRE